METHSPRRLGRYQLLERIAVGGMAEVYKAVAQGLSGFEKSVVVKRLLPQHQRDQELLTMFVDEARLLGRLRHPNIAEVYDIDHEGNEYFFALEYVDGIELRALLTTVPGQALDLAQSLWITLEVAKALSYAHGLTGDDGKALGIVHRDVSPSNVLLGLNGAVKLVDFGVAKWRTQRSETRHGVLKGKVSYMSPEQCRGEPLDQRSDIFALGVLLYEMTVGQRPFAGGSDFETLKAIAEGHYLPPSSKRSGYPPALETLCVAMLELQRDQRPTSMGDVIASLQAFALAQNLALEPQVLVDHVRAVKVVAESPAVHEGDPLEGLPTGPDALRLSVDRTATVAATVEYLATVPPTAASLAPEPQKPGKRSLKVALGLFAAGAVLTTLGVWVSLGNQSPERVSPAHPQPVAAPSRSQAITKPEAEPVASAQPNLAPSPPARPARRVPPATKTVAPPAVRVPPQPVPAPRPTVWDLDSPVPP